MRQPPRTALAFATEQAGPSQTSGRPEPRDWALPALVARAAGRWERPRGAGRPCTPRSGLRRRSTPSRTTAHSLRARPHPQHPQPNSVPSNGLTRQRARRSGKQRAGPPPLPRGQGAGRQTHINGGRMPVPPHQQPQPQPLGRGAHASERYTHWPHTGAGQPAPRGARQAARTQGESGTRFPPCWHTAAPRLGGAEPTRPVTGWGPHKGTHREGRGSGAPTGLPANPSCRHGGPKGAATTDAPPTHHQRPVIKPKSAAAVGSNGRRGGARRAAGGPGSQTAPVRPRRAAAALEGVARGVERV
jgi:hypothetical protein